MQKLKRPRRRPYRPEFWWNGGTLHESTLAEWFDVAGIYHPQDLIANQMATMADFVVNAATKMPEAEPKIDFNNPMELLTFYVMPLIQGLEMIKGQDHLYHWHTKNQVLLQMFHNGWLGKNVVEHQIYDIRAERIRKEVLP